MQTNSYPNRFQYTGGGKQKPLLSDKKATPQQPIEPQPIYYAPVMMGQAPEPQATTKSPAPKGFLGKLWHMVSEESTTERPIGISQLTRTTFNVRKEVAHTSFFKNGQTIQDYRFNQLTQPGDRFNRNF